MIEVECCQKFQENITATFWETQWQTQRGRKQA